MSDFTPRTLEDLQHTFPPDIEHLSATGMKVALRCSEQYRRIYVKGMRKAPSLALAAGRADHKAIETSMRQKIESGEDLPSSEVEQVFLEDIEGTVAEAGGIKELEGSPDTKEWDRARLQGMDGVRKYNDLAAPGLTPIEVEEPFSLIVPHVPVPLIGYLDLVAFGNGGKLRIIDRKRSGRAPSRLAPDWRFQASVYQLYRPLRHDWHVTVANKRSVTTSLQNDVLSLDPIDQEVTAQQVAMIAAQIGFLYQRYGPDDPWPASGVTHPWACDFCGFRPECWAWK